MTPINKAAYKLYQEDTGVYHLKWEDLDPNVQNFYRRKAMKWAMKKKRNSL
jgi:hypothetical protein